ncbi:MAG TPA: S8 family serine peptidase [Methylomirabilota bacterium]|jgi:hypothetical protein|nr:S8 family serine peptidase [Methylomirabilota bacterium]
MVQHSATATGAGVRVALIDSGINPRHPHVGAVTGGIAFFLAEDGTVQHADDYIDRRGHGTALAGIVRAKAPGVKLYAVKIFRDPRTPNDTLVTSIAVLEAGLQWAIAQRMHIINLSLGTENPDHRDRLSALVQQAQAQGSLLVASSPPGRTDMLPAALPGVISVAGDETCGWDDHRYIARDPVPFRAHPWPRPIPGVPQERNFHGHSCASAHLTAALARFAQTATPLPLHEALEHLRQTAKDNGLD